jgi:hypothetical protein
LAAIGTAVALNEAAVLVMVAEDVEVAFVTFKIGRLLVPTADTTAAPVSRSVYPTRSASPPAEQVPPEPGVVVEMVAKTE